jgi:hypothetical protein
VAAARIALICRCPPPTATAIARPRSLVSGLCCRLSTDPLLFAFVHAGCAHVHAHVSLASRTSQHLRNAHLAFIHFQSLQPCPPLPSVSCLSAASTSHIGPTHFTLHWTCGVAGLLATEVLLQHSCGEAAVGSQWGKGARFLLHLLGRARHRKRFLGSRKPALAGGSEAALPWRQGSERHQGF